MSIEFTQNMQILSNLATVGAFGATIATFVILYRRSRRSEEYSIANDVSKSLTELEHKILETPDEAVDLKLLRHRQYLNVWEWFAFLVNHEELSNENILNYFRPLFMSDYEEYSGQFPELTNNNVSEFREIRRLHERWANP